MKQRTLILVLVLLLTAALARAGEYAIDPDHSEIGFSVRHMVITNVKGAFREYEAGFSVDTSNRLVSLKADIAAASIDTRIQKRDDHLRSEDFLAVATYPRVTFTTTAITPSTQNTYKVMGLLRIRSKVQEIELDGELTGPVKDPWGNQRMGIVLRGEIDRRSFDVNYNKTLETGGLLIGNDVSIHLEGEGILQK